MPQASISTYYKYKHSSDYHLIQEFLFYMAVCKFTRGVVASWEEEKTGDDVVEITKVFMSAQKYQIDISSLHKCFRRNFPSCLCFWEYSCGSLKVPAEMQIKVSKHPVGLNCKTTHENYESPSLTSAPPVLHEALARPLKVHPRLLREA